jgi:hypothetical protein
MQFRIGSRGRLRPVRDKAASLQDGAAQDPEIDHLMDRQGVGPREPMPS